MRFVRLLPRLVVLLLPMLFAPLAHAAEDASGFMADLGNRVLAIVNEKATPEAQRKQQFHQLADESFDIPKIAQFVLGRYWRTASEDERQRFVTAFEHYMIQVYWSRFNSYNGESFKVSGQQDEGNGTILVTTIILRPISGQPPVKVSWSVIKQSASFKIRDASLEGVSQALTYRDEFASIIERNGGKVSELITQLNNRANS